MFHGRVLVFHQGPAECKPEKFSIYWKQLVRELDNFGWGSLGIVALVLVFMGAVILIQTVYNLVNPLVPMSAVGIVARDSIILEFSHHDLPGYWPVRSVPASFGDRYHAGH